MLPPQFGAFYFAGSGCRQTFGKNNYARRFRKSARVISMMSLRSSRAAPLPSRRSAVQRKRRSLSGPLPNDGRWMPRPLVPDLPAAGRRGSTPSAARSRRRSTTSAACSRRCSTTYIHVGVHPCSVRPCRRAFTGPQAQHGYPVSALAGLNCLASSRYLRSLEATVVGATPSSSATPS